MDKKKRIQTPKVVKVPIHGSAYKVVSGELAYAPILDSGKPDKTYSPVTEAPKRFRKGHQLALAKLGIPKSARKKMLEKITYYEQSQLRDAENG